MVRARSLDMRAVVMGFGVSVVVVVSMRMDIWMAMWVSIWVRIEARI